MDVLHQLEIQWILFLQSIGAWLAEPLRLVSMLGNEEFLILVMPSIYWSLDTALGLRVGIMLLLSNGLNTAIKLAFHAPRPYWLDARVHGYVAESSFGIPSGHAQNAAGIWGLIAAARRRTWERAALVGIIVIIGFSRIYLGVHFISDVLAGWLIGGLLLAALLKVEQPLGTWLRARTFPEMLALALVTSVLLGSVTLLAAAFLGNWQIPVEWIQNALHSQPDSPIDPLNLENAFTMSGTWFGLMVGVAWLFHRQGGFDAAGTPAQRLLRYLVGVVGIFILWYGLGSVLPRSADVLSYALRYARYTLVGLWVSALAPLLFERLGLSRAPEKVFPPLSSRENPL